MSLINEALKRAEMERRCRRVRDDRPRSVVPYPVPHRKPDAPMPRPSPAKKTRLRAALFLALVVTTGIGVLAYLSMPPAQKHLPLTRTRQTHVRPSGPLAGPHQAAAAESSIDRTLFALADYQPPAIPTTKAAAQDPPLAPAPPPPAPTSQATEAKRLDPNDFTLGGVMRSGEDAHAIINGHLVSVGEEVKGAKVVEIHRYHVVLERGSQRLKLRL